MSMSAKTGSRALQGASNVDVHDQPDSGQDKDARVLSERRNSSQLSTKAREAGDRRGRLSPARELQECGAHA